MCMTLAEMSTHEAFSCDASQKREKKNLSQLVKLFQVTKKKKKLPDMVMRDEQFEDELKEFNKQHPTPKKQNKTRQGHRFGKWNDKD